MPEVVTAQSGPQGRASTSWDILQQPSPEEALGEQPKAEPPESTERSDTVEQSAETKAVETNGQEQQQSEEPKDGEHKEKLSRYERTKRQKKALEQREAELAKRERTFAEEERARAAREEEAKKPPYTVKELKQYRKVWEKESRQAAQTGDWQRQEQLNDLVQKADAEVTRLEAESKQTVDIPRSGTPEFTQQWESAEQELYRLDPEFQREGTRLDKVLRQMMTGPDGAVYRQHPRGIVAAYHRARLAITEADLSAARGEIQKLKGELTRLNGLTSIGGSGGAGRSVADMRGKDFASMSTKEMRDHLKRNATRGHW